ncbi:hypothetical protein HPP92_023736 [Vanilla planifolia]|uniref:STAS domain-containing protein n=1 Tax=Vanilla planifolia TaxID=51239 RepID=A0A835UCA4_VANPL|nr:hypothetical protein HPP92_023736 [Vanilla planifolia]
MEREREEESFSCWPLVVNVTILQNALGSRWHISMGCFLKQFMGAKSSKELGSPAVTLDNDVSLPSRVQDLEQLNIHKVSSAERKSTLPALKQGLGEVFFPDDPLHKFKDKPFHRKLVLGLQCLFPILQWAPQYDLHTLRSDTIAGITIATLAIPQGISYAKLANLPPIIGLYSSFLPPLIYSILGSSRELAIGPVSISSVVMGSMLSEAVSPEKEPFLYLRLAFTATFFAGVFQASLGLFRLGFIMDYLSKPTVMGFMGGAAIITTLQQLKYLLGISNMPSQTSFVPFMLSMFHQRTQWKWETIVTGFSFLAFLMLAKQVSSRRHRLFWVSVAAPITSVIVATIISIAIEAEKHGIQIIGYVQQGANPFSTDLLIFSGPYFVYTIKVGIATGILSLTDALAAGRTFASLRNYQIDGNKEMMAIGLMNLMGSCTSCYITSGSISRTAVNHSAGCKTAFSNIVMASVVFIMMRFLMPVLYHTPDVVLSAIIIAGVIKLIDFPAAVHLWKVDKLDFITCLTAFFGVLFYSVQMGLAIAVGTSVLKILMHVTRPNIVIMGNVQGTHSYRNLEQYKEAKRVPSFLILGVESPIYFANSAYFLERIMRWIREEEERAANIKERGIRCVVLDMSTVTAIDTTGIDALLELKKTLKRSSLHLVLANPIGEVIEKLRASKAWEKFASKHIYMGVGEAIVAVSCLLEVMPKDKCFNNKFWKVYNNEAFLGI